MPRRTLSYGKTVLPPPGFTPLARIGNRKIYGYLKYHLVKSRFIVTKTGTEGWSNFPKGLQPANSIAGSRTQVTIPGLSVTLATSCQIFLSLHSDDVLGNESYEYQIPLCLNSRTKMHNEIIMCILPLAQMIKSWLSLDKKKHYWCENRTFPWKVLRKFLWIYFIVKNCFIQFLIIFNWQCLSLSILYLRFLYIK